MSRVQAISSNVHAKQRKTGLKWALAEAGATGGGTDQVFYENARVMTTNYTITSSKSASTVGPLTINSGVTLTIPSGERLVIL